MSKRPFIRGNSIWVTTVAFMNLFNDLEVRNYTERYGNGYDRRLKVDVSLDTKERLQHKLLAGGHKKLEQSDTRLPRISIQIANITPDRARYTGKNFKRTIAQNGTDIVTDIQPYPVKVEYTVSIWAKYFEHYAQILENVIPWFDSYLTVGVKERNFGIERELKVNLNDVGQNSTFELEGSQARLVRGDMSFTVETQMYKVLNDNDSDVIHKATTVLVEMINPISSETIVVEVDPLDFIT